MGVPKYSHNYRSLYDTSKHFSTHYIVMPHLAVQVGTVQIQLSPCVVLSWENKWLVRPLCHTDSCESLKLRAAVAFNSSSFSSEI